MHLWHDITPGEKVPNEIEVIIENPRGTHNKYEIDKETNLIRLDRVLYGDNFYPFDYGFVPQTYWEDGDPLDVIVLSTNPMVPLCQVTVRPIGVMRMIDGGESDDKIIAVTAKDPRFDHITKLEDIGEYRQKEWKHLFETMKLLQNKEVKVTGFEGAEAAKETIEKAMKAYQEKFGK